MTILSRMARLLRADINAMLDRFEAPELILSQALREMEQALDRDRQEMARLERESRRLAEREADLLRLSQGDEAALSDCLDAGEEDLARSVVRRRLERERQLESLRRSLARVAEARETLRREMAERSARLAELRLQAEMHEEVRHDAEDPVPSDIETSWGVRDTDVEVALLHAKRAREMGS